MEGGCSDDSFLDFQESLVFLGRKTEYGLATVIDEACIARAGSPIKWNGSGDIRGEFIDEDDLPAQYPELTDWIDAHSVEWSAH